MNWQLWTVVAYIAFQALWMVGKTRVAYTPGLAAAGLVEYGAVIALLIWGATS
jgi:hypothetical protein